VAHGGAQDVVLARGQRALALGDGGGQLARRRVLEEEAAGAVLERARRR
jgi:hypothetical protein